MIRTFFNDPLTLGFIGGVVFGIYNLQEAYKRPENQRPELNMALSATFFFWAFLGFQAGLTPPLILKGLVSNPPAIEQIQKTKSNA